MFMSCMILLVGFTQFQPALVRRCTESFFTVGENARLFLQSNCRWHLARLLGNA